MSTIPPASAARPAAVPAKSAPAVPVKAAPAAVPAKPVAAAAPAKPAPAALPVSTIPAAMPSIPSAMDVPAAVTTSLLPGMTISELVFSRMPANATPAEKMQATAEVMKMNGLMTWDSAKSIPANKAIKLPANLSKPTDQPVQPAAGAPAPPPAAPPQNAPAPTPVPPPAPPQARQPAEQAPAVQQPQVQAAQVSASQGAQSSAQRNGQGLTTRQNDPNKLTIAQIDVFSPDNTGFNHGTEIAQTIAKGGADPNLAGQMGLLQYRVEGTGPLDTTLAARTGDALQDVINRVRAGQDVDAVNMSLQDFMASGNAGRVRQLVQQLISMNVPVLVAAGNGGAQAVNQLTLDGAFVVQSATNGTRNASSGIGNIQGEASTTSFATAMLSPKFAAIANSGMSVQQMRAALGIDKPVAT